MVTNHQVILSGLTAGTTYYYQVQSTDSKNNNGKSGGHKFGTAGVSISGTITPTQGGSGATVTLSGTTSATITTNGSGAYTFAGLPSGSYGITPSDSGYTFTPANQNVTVGTTNLTGVNFTATATAVAPTITTQPVNQTVTAGQAGTFSVTATGTAPLSYQWQKNGANIAGATSSSYITPATTTSDSGSTFDVAVSNAAGTATSNAATLTVNTAPVAPTITTQPANQTVTAGQTATFAAVASGTAPLGYQWQKNGANIAGATSSSYITPATTTSDSGSTFDVAVSNAAGTATSNAATLTVNAAPVAPTITTQPTNQTVTAGQTATFAAVASGTAPLSYQWQKNGANIAGATSTRYTTPGTTMADSGSSFRLVVTNTAGTATSNAATLTVNAAPVAPTITAQPANQTVIAGQTATFAAVASGTAPLSYQWQKNGANIAGATSSSYTTPGTTMADSGASFRLVVTNTAGTATSNAATLTVNAATVQLTATPSSLTFGNVNVGSSSAQTVSLDNTGNSNVNLSQINVAGAGLAVSGLTPPLTLPPGQTATLNVAFAPTAPGPVSGTVSVVSNATNSPATITLTGTGVQSGPALAFPGAQGGGALSVGGRGGTVYFVTNTADSGPGSLRTCVDASGPRICLFQTGGTIGLLNPLIISNPFITIAGQTAPGGGIQISGPSGANAPSNPAIFITTHDVVVRYLRVRRGYNAGEICNQSPWSCGANIVVLSNTTAHNPYNIVLDHISSEWSDYEALIVLGGNTAVTYPRSLTISYSILGEALAGAGQTTLAEAGGYSGQGSTAPDGMTDIDFHHNLFAGGNHRLPLSTVKSSRLVNNFVYAWEYYGMRNKGWRDFIANYFALRTGQLIPTHEIQAWTTNDGNDTSFAPSFYLSGNVGPDDPTGTLNWTLMTALTINESAGESLSPLSTSYSLNSPIPTPSGYVPITPDPVATVAGPMLNAARGAPFDGVGASRQLSCKGAWQDARDSVDNRIVIAVANGTTLFGSYDYSSLSASPQSQNDLGGWPTLAAGTPCTDSNNNGLPDVWESYWGGIFGLGTTLDPNAFNFGDGYTNLEHYLNGMSPSP